MRIPLPAYAAGGDELEGATQGRTRTLGLIVAAGGALLALMWSLAGDAGTAADREAFALLATTHHSLPLHLVVGLSRVGPVLLALSALAVAGWLVRKRRLSEAAVIVLGSLATLLAADIGKAIAARPRPHGALIYASGTSFPSTDAALSVLVVVLALALEGGTVRGVRQGRLVAGAVLVSALTGILLIVLRVHYLTDVLAGWGLGAAVFAACGLVAVAAGARSRRPARGRP